LSKMFPNSSSLRTWDMDSPHEFEGMIQDPKKCESWLILTTHLCNLWLMIGFTRLNQCQNSWKTANAALQRHMMQPPASNAPTRFQQA
jgi:hypothetical protein